MHSCVPALFCCPPCFFFFFMLFFMLFLLLCSLFFVCHERCLFLLTLTRMFALTHTHTHTLSLSPFPSALFVAMIRVLLRYGSNLAVTAVFERIWQTLSGNQDYRSWCFEERGGRVVENTVLAGFICLFQH